MCKKSMYVGVVMMVGLMLVSQVSAELVAHWTFDDGSGNTATDSVDNAHPGTIGGTANWVNGQSGGALDFDGLTNYVDIEGENPIISGTFSLTMWVYARNIPTAAKEYRMPLSNDSWVDGAIHVHIMPESAIFKIDTKNGTDMPSNTVIEADRWYHIAGTLDAEGESKIYIDGVLDNSATGNSKEYFIGPANIGGYQNNSRFFDGMIDDVRIYSHILSEAEIQEIMKSEQGLAATPSPIDGATDLPRDVVLNWTPGEYAPAVDGHTVYWGENFNDVNDGIGGLTQDANSLDLGRLAFGTTYYWRVDEVNGAPDFTVFPGKVWSFTVEPISYPITPVAATASSAHDLEMVPTKTIDGSGLSAEDLHSTMGADMWLSSNGDAQPWIQYEFAKAQKLHEMWIWNSNQSIEVFVGLGAKELSIETSMDGVTWAALADVPEIAQASSSADYAANTVVDFGGVSAQYVKLTLNAGWGQLGQLGLSEVRFFAMPVQAREPHPADGAAVDSVAVKLKWRVGREAAQHEVVLSSDLAAVEDGSAVIAAVSDNALSPTSINYSTTYYWQINEVNEAELPARHVGAIWSFSTPDYLVVDDFESYNDDCDRVFFTWEDGFGHNGSEGLEGCVVPPSNGNGTGSIVGNAMAPFAETSIVQDGSQAMPVVYDNTGGAANSETTRSFAPAQDWTVGSPETLVLHFYGDMGNSGGQLYVKINNAKVSFDSSPSAMSTPFWSQWNIALSAVGTDLSRVNTLTIGVEGAGAQGVVYVDSIRLYGRAPEPMLPQDPGSANLVAYYALENNAQDGSGNGHNGAVEGGPTWVSPGWNGTGACMRFGGADDRITAGSFDVSGSGITLAAWINPEVFTNDARMMSKSEGSSTADHYWAMVLSGSGENNLQFRLRTDQGNTTSRTSSGHGVQAGEWTHVAATWDASDPYQRMYKNGVQIYSRAKDGTAVATGPGVKTGIGNQSISAGAENARPFDGLMDEVRIYSRGLSQAELLYVAFGQ